MSTSDFLACSVLGFACQSIHGPETEDFWRALQSETTPERYTWTGEQNGKLGKKLAATFSELTSNAPPLVVNERLGVILASTKGEIENYIWDQTAFQSHHDLDGMTPLLNQFLADAALAPALKLCVSNACASSLSAVFLAQRWLAQNRVDQVLIIAADAVGPFVEKGFEALHALSQGKPRPFSRERDGLALGEATAMILLGKSTSPIGIQIGAVGIDAEGYAVTRPSPSGQSLIRASTALPKLTPDLIIAHGTGTQVNDAAEDRTFFELYGQKPAITGSKWAIGHTLGTSGLMDLIAGCLVLRDQKAFPLATTETADPEFRSRYLTRGSKTSGEFRHVLISSLGFGGIHAMGMLSKVGS